MRLDSIDERPEIKDGDEEEKKADVSKFDDRNVDSIEKIVNDELEISESFDDMAHLEQVRSGNIPNPLEQMTRSHIYNL